MARPRILWTDQAKVDLRDIRRYIAKNAPRTALAFVKRLRTAVEKLKRFPEIGSLVPEFEEQGLREILYGDYRIIYRQKHGTVMILAVQHGAKPLRQSLLRE